MEMYYKVANNTNEIVQTQTGVAERQYEEVNRENNATVQEKQRRTKYTDLITLMSNKNLRSSNCAEQGRHIFFRTLCLRNKLIGIELQEYEYLFL